MVKGLLFVPILLALVALTLTRAEEEKVVCVYNSKAHLREGNKYFALKIYLNLKENSTESINKWVYVKPNFEKLNAILRANT